MHTEPSKKQYGKDDLCRVLMNANFPMQFKCAAVLFAVGLSDEQVAKILDLLGPVDAEIMRERTQETVLAIQVAMNYPVEKRIAVATAAAMDIKMRIMASSADDKLKNIVATEMLDRNLGKPVQTTQSLNMNVNVGGKNLDAQLDLAMQRLALLQGKREKLTLSHSNNVSGSTTATN
jgi:hypothetical protein